LIAKIEAEEPTLRLAVLIDADNAQAAVIEGLLAEIARYGEATVKRIYGDFTAPTRALPTTPAKTRYSAHHQNLT
jgi:hypothetical protein